MFNLPFDANKPIMGKASIIVNRSIEEVFEFIGEHFFENYPKWAVDLVKFEPLDGSIVYVGAKAQQIKHDQGKEIATVFQIENYQPLETLGTKGLAAEYRDFYHLETSSNAWATQLTYSFELLNIELFMRPFEKLIRYAIEDGAEATADNIKNLLQKTELASA